jgi:rare lipoprotein A
LRKVLTHTLVIVMVTSLGAARQPDNSKANPAATVVGSHRPRVKGTPVRRARTAKPHTSGNKPYQIGRASWYGKHFHGKKTASGERYNMFQFTAAHKALPLGSLVKVTNLRNGLWVVVRINDRGPIPHSRIIDLSYGAAQMLQLRAEGVERVRLDVVHSDVARALHPQGTEIAGMQ